MLGRTGAGSVRGRLEVQSSNLLYGELGLQHPVGDLDTSLLLHDVPVGEGKPFVLLTHADMPPSAPCCCCWPSGQTLWRPVCASTFDDSQAQVRGRALCGRMCAVGVGSGRGPRLALNPCTVGWQAGEALCRRFVQFTCHRGSRHGPSTQLSRANTARCNALFPADYVRDAGVHLRENGRCMPAARAPCPHTRSQCQRALAETLHLICPSLSMLADVCPSHGQSIGAPSSRV